MVTGAYALGAVYYDNRCCADRLQAQNCTAEERKEKLKARTIDNSLWHLLATVRVL
jgi:hypothetical protein